MAGSLRKARKLPPLQDGSLGFLEGPCGNPDYASPEVLSWTVDGTRRIAYGLAADVWSVGVLLYMMLCGSMPFRGDTPTRLHRSMGSAKIGFPSYNDDGSRTCWPRISLAAKDLIEQMLRLDPAGRPSVESALQHPWLQDGYDHQAVRAVVSSLRERERSLVRDWSRVPGETAPTKVTHSGQADDACERLSRGQGPWRLHEGEESSATRGPLHLLSNWLNGWLRGRRHHRVLLLGLDGAGKSTLLQQLKCHGGSEQVKTTPTVGHDIAHFERGACSFTVCDIGGQRRVRSQWARYLNPRESADAFNESLSVIFVVDAADATRLPEARDELNGLLRDPRLSKTPLLVFANKMDLEDALPATDIGERLGLARESGTCCIRGGSTRTGQGAVAALDWVAANATAVD